MRVKTPSKSNMNAMQVCEKQHKHGRDPHLCSCQENEANDNGAHKLANDEENNRIAVHQTCQQNAPIVHPRRT